jgi:hypothetical protein
MVLLRRVMSAGLFLVARDIIFKEAFLKSLVSSFSELKA